MRIIAGYGRVSTRFVQNGSYLQRTLQISAGNVKQGVFDADGHDGVVRIYILSWVMAGSRHDLFKMAHICGVRCRKVLKACSRGFSTLTDMMAASEFAYRRGLR